MSVSTVILVKQKSYIRKFRVAGAVDAVSARTPESLDVRKSIIFFRLVRMGVLIDAGNGSYYLDAPREEFVRKRRQKAMLMLVIILIVVAMLSFVLIGRNS